MGVSIPQSNQWKVCGMDRKGRKQCSKQRIGSNEVSLLISDGWVVEELQLVV